MTDLAARPRQDVPPINAPKRSSRRPGPSA